MHSPKDLLVKRFEAEGCQSPLAFKELIELFEGYRSDYGKAPDWEKSKLFLQERLSRGESVIYVASSAGKTVGFVQLFPIFSSVSLGKAWILNDLYVAPEARGWGAGRLLTQESLDHCRRDGAVWVMLQTAPDNTRAQNLYKSLGFVQDEDFPTWICML